MRVELPGRPGSRVTTCMGGGRTGQPERRLQRTALSAACAGVPDRPQRCIIIRVGDRALAELAGMSADEGKFSAGYQRQKHHDAGDRGGTRNRSPMVRHATLCRARRAAGRAAVSAGLAAARSTDAGPRTEVPSPTRRRQPAQPRNPGADSITYSSSAVLPTLGSPPTTSAPLRPARAASSSPSSTGRSARRSSSTTGSPDS